MTISTSIDLSGSKKNRFCYYGYLNRKINKLNRIGVFFNNPVIL